jgi:hypothetical protein
MPGSGVTVQPGIESRRGDLDLGLASTTSSVSQLPANRTWCVRLRRSRSRYPADGLDQLVVRSPTGATLAIAQQDQVRLRLTAVDVDVPGGAGPRRRTSRAGRLSNPARCRRSRPRRTRTLPIVAGQPAGAIAAGAAHPSLAHSRPSPLGTHMPWHGPLEVRRPATERMGGVFGGVSGSGLSGV